MSDCSVVRKRINVLIIKAPFSFQASLFLSDFSSFSFHIYRKEICKEVFVCEILTIKFLSVNYKTSANNEVRSSQNFENF